jgi:hypothetical protein
MADAAAQQLPLVEQIAACRAQAIPSGISVALDLWRWMVMDSALTPVVQEDHCRPSFDEWYAIFRPLDLNVLERDTQTIATLQRGAEKTGAHLSLTVMEPRFRRYTRFRPEAPEPGALAAYPCPPAPWNAAWPRLAAVYTHFTGPFRDVDALRAGINAQLAPLVAYARAQGFAGVVEFADFGSRANFDREGLEALLLYGAHDWIGHVVVADRRDLTLCTDGEWNGVEWRDVGVEVHVAPKLYQHRVRRGRQRS